MATQPKKIEVLDEIFLEPLEENDIENSSEDAYIMVLENNSIVSIIAPPPPVANEIETLTATCKLDESILHRFEEQQLAIKRIEEQQRELKLMYKKS